MDVPLSAERTIIDGRQYVTIWSRGERHVVEAPFLPYCYAREPFDEGAIEQRQVTVRPLSTLEEESWHRCSFATVRDLVDVAHQRDAGEIADANIPFITRILVDQPDHFRQWPNGPPKALVFDIEQLTRGGRFPLKRDPLISIAWAVDDGGPQCVTGDGETDRDILEAFLSAVAEADPDLIVGYNVRGYDIPMVLDRCAANGIDPSPLVRPHGRIERSTGRDPTRLVSRLIYDVYDRVRQDQTLYGIKDRKLKTVARWRGIDVVEEDTSNTAALVGTERLRTYNISDVVATRALGVPYLANLIALADFYGAPLGTVIEATSNFHCTVLQGRIMARHGVVSDGTNGERYAALYDETGGEAFVGGIVELYQRGVFRPVTKVDFASMYPSILVALGAGAENTRYLGRVEEGAYEVRRDGDTLEMLVPDPSRDTRHRVRIEGRSELADQLGELLDYRLELKAEVAAATSDAERQRATARQGMVKVILNSVYGVMASRHARYASLPVAMAIVGTARHLIRHVEQLLGDAKIETDTDGVYVAGEVDPAPLNEAVNRFVTEVLGGSARLRVDAERFPAGYFHQGKNYVLLRDDGGLDVHGVAFKGSSRAALFDIGLERVAKALLTEAEDVDEIASDVLDLSNYERDDFVMRVRLGKDPDAYASPNHLAAQVARAAQRRGQRPRRGDQLHYVKVVDGYDVAEGDAFDRLDERYYQDQLAKLLARLGVRASPRDQRSLSDFM